jgi:hypothetical protein
MIHQWARKHNIPAAALSELLALMGMVSTMPETCSGAAGTEADLQFRIRALASRKGIRLWRNNKGVAQSDNGRVVRYGLCNDSAAMDKIIKSSDLIGIKPNGQFICREVKAPGWRYTGTEREKAQLKFIELVLSMGGDAAFTTREDCV